MKWSEITEWNSVDFKTPDFTKAFDVGKINSQLGHLTVKKYFIKLYKETHNIIGI